MKKNNVVTGYSITKTTMFSLKVKRINYSFEYFVFIEIYSTRLYLWDKANGIREPFRVREHVVGIAQLIRAIFLLHG